MLPCPVNQQLHTRQSPNSRAISALPLPSSSSTFNLQLWTSFSLTFQPSNPNLPTFRPTSSLSYLHTGPLPRLISFVCHSPVPSGAEGYENTRGSHFSKPKSGRLSCVLPIHHCLPYSTSFFSCASALFCPTATRQLFCNQWIAHSFHRNGGCTPLDVPIEAPPQLWSGDSRPEHLGDPVGTCRHSDVQTRELSGKRGWTAGTGKHLPVSWTSCQLPWQGRRCKLKLTQSKVRS
jgi:hypothetical protein